MEKIILTEEDYKNVFSIIKDYSQLILLDETIADYNYLIGFELYYLDKEVSQFSLNEFDNTSIWHFQLSTVGSSNFYARFERNDDGWELLSLFNSSLPNRINSLIASLPFEMNDILGLIELRSFYIEAIMIKNKEEISIYDLDLDYTQKDLIKNVNNLFMNKYRNTNIVIGTFDNTID